MGKKYFKFISILCFLSVFLMACAAAAEPGAESARAKKTEQESADPAADNPKQDQTENRSEFRQNDNTNPIEAKFDLRTLTDYKYIALTFDDGPIPENEEQLLELFSKYNGFATFFYNGYRVEESPEVLSKIIEQGSEIGNHSYNHPNFKELTAEQTLAEVEDLNDLIEKNCGVRPVWVRPPFGEFNQTTLDILPFSLVTWNQSSRDWEKQDVDFILENILNTSPGSIILCHSTIDETIQAVAQALPILYEQGYRFVTLSDLFEIYGVEPQKHQIYWFPKEGE